jgi:hypothetical protein
MRATDIALIAVVGALGLFVASQVVTRQPTVNTPPPPPRAPAPAAAAAVSPAAATLAAGADVDADSTDIATSTIKSSATAPTRDLKQILARIAETPGTYMTEMIADLNGHLVRWPDRRQEGLRVWVQSETPVPNWDPRYAQMARDAFDDWGRDAELPMRFDFVLDSASSDIRVLWIDHFAATLGQRVGVTRRTSDQFGWLVDAQLIVAIHDSAGRSIPPPALAGIVRHEAGHALGLGHSKDQRTKMYPTETRSDISPADRSTIRLLYQLPPGQAR